VQPEDINLTRERPVFLFAVEQKDALREIALRSGY